MTAVANDELNLDRTPDSQFLHHSHLVDLGQDDAVAVQLHRVETNIGGQRLGLSPSVPSELFANRRR